jgi:hypothetical protein
MQPPVEHPSYEYSHDEALDRRRYGWPILKYATCAAIVLLLILLAR